MLRRLGAGAVAGALCLIPAATALGHSLADLEDMLLQREAYVEIVERPATDFALQDGDGRVVSLVGLRGQVVVLWFIYASCPDVCPLHSEAMAGVQEAVNGTPMRDLVRFVAITTDPARDGADVLSDYGPAHGLDSANFVFLSSGAAAPEETRALAEAYGLRFTPEADGYQMHGVVTHLIDKSGTLRARYHGLKFDPTNLIVHINALTNDDH